MPGRHQERCRPLWVSMGDYAYSWDRSRDFARKTNVLLLFFCAVSVRNLVRNPPQLGLFVVTRRPVSRVLSRMAIHLGRLFPGAACDRPGRRRKHLQAAMALPSLFGLAPGGVCRAVSVAGHAVRSYRTVSPLPIRHEPAVCFLWHFPWSRLRRELPGAVFPWSPDFPPPPRRRQPSGRLVAGLNGTNRTRSRVSKCGRDQAGAPAPIILRVAPPP